MFLEILNKRRLEGGFFGHYQRQLATDLPL